MKYLVFVLGACTYNRGAEAIIRGFASVVKRDIFDLHLTLSSSEKEFGASMQLPMVDEYVRRNRFYSRLSPAYLPYLYYRKVAKNEQRAGAWLAGGLLKACKCADLVFVAGADHYDKAYGSRHRVFALNQQIRAVTKGKMVLFDCSLAPEEIDDEVRKDLRLFDAVTARDVITYQGFLQEGLSQRIDYYPDPAFAMPSEKIALPESLLPKETVGVNVSSLITASQYGSGEVIVIRSYLRLIERILSTTPHNVMLIPHVMHGNDLSILKRLYEHYRDSPRVFLVADESLNAPQIKYLIAQCCFYIGARTHSTIAAYSSCVPTLVLGYSVKSIGIAQDLFGTNNGYVVPVQGLANENELANAFSALYASRASVGEQLERIMPGYVQKVDGVSALVKSLLEEKRNGCEC